MADENEITVNLKILQAQDLNRMGELSKSLERVTSALMANVGGTAMRQVTQNAGGVLDRHGRPLVSPIGSYASMSAPPMAPSSHETTRMKGIEAASRIDASQRRIEANRKLLEGSIGGPMGGLAATWSRAGAVSTEVEQAVYRGGLASRGPLNAENVLQQISYHSGNMAMRNVFDEEGNLTGQSPSRTWASVSGYSGLAAQGINFGGGVVRSGAGTLDRIINNPLAQSGRQLGYSRGEGGFASIEGMKVGARQWWEEKRTGWFGLNPYTQNEDQVMATMNSLGLNMEFDRNRQYFKDILGLSNRTGIRGEDLAQDLEAIRRNSPDSLGKVMKQLDQLGETAQKTGYSMDVLYKSLMAGSKQMSNQFGRSQSQYMKGLEKASLETGLLPEQIAGIASDKGKNFLWASMAGVSPGEIQQDPGLAVKMQTEFYSQVTGVDPGEYYRLSPQERKEADRRQREFAALPGAEFFTGGMTFEQMAMMQFQGDISKGRRNRVNKYFAENSDKLEKPSQKTINKLAQMTYGKGSDGYRAWKGLTKDMTRQEQLDDLRRRTGSKSPDYLIGLSGEAKKWFKLATAPTQNMWEPVESVFRGLTNG